MPKRSSGCDLCRRRKVRCDEARPRCQRCTNFGAVCPGYTRTESVIFRHQTTTTASKSKPRRVIRPHDQGLPWESLPDSFEGDLSDPSLAILQHASPFDINSTMETRSLLLAGLLDTYMPRPELGSNDIENQYSYLAELPNSLSTNIAFTTAVDALTVVNLGTNHRDQTLLHQSRLIYGKALSYLYRALLHPRLQAQDETLAAVSILGLCDFFRGTSQNGAGWLSHAAGAKGLLKHRGPGSIKSPLALKLFLSQRNTSLLGGFFARKGVYFDAPEWLGLTADLATTNDWVAITDIMVHIPALLEETDAKCLARPPDAPWDNKSALEAFSVLERYNELQGRLEEWYSNLTLRRDGEIYQSVDVMELTEFWNMCPDLAFPTVLYFSSFYLAYLYALYSFAAFVLCKNAADVRARLSPRLSPPQSLPANQQHRSLPSSTVLRQLAHHHITQLARSIPYLCSSPSASVGRIQSLAFLFFVQDYFDGSRGKFPLEEESDASTENASHQNDHTPQYLWCWKIYTALAGKGIVPPRARIQGQSKLAPPSSGKTVSTTEDDVGDSIGRVVKNLGVSVRSVSISEDDDKPAVSSTSAHGYKTSPGRDALPDSGHTVSETAQEVRPSKDFLKFEKGFVENTRQWNDSEAAYMTVGE